MNNREIPCPPEELESRKAILSEINQVDSFISGLLGAMEGNKGDIETPEQKTLSMRETADTLRGFFKSTPTDSEAIQKIAEEAGKLGLGHHEYKFVNYIDFYLDISSELHRDISSSEYKKYEQFIFDTANKHKLIYSSPLEFIRK